MPFKKNCCLLLLAGTVYVMASSFKSNHATSLPSGTDSLLSKKAFASVYDVLMSPRCMNCHPAGDIPLVGEDSKLHSQSVKRGKDGKGMYASKCANCHTEKNQPGLNMPPGNLNWHMPPADMKMVFQGKTARELATLLLDPSANGNKTKEDLIKHVAEDGLVLAGWDPGEGRKTPPLSHDEFVKQFKLWIENGAYLPD
ncbi:MAG: hypothetical protein IPP72_05135 [Chitinophagaceae bacterium]|nr:hypothetical protein [Chitinophagaceae bacterium]